MILSVAFDSGGTAAVRDWIKPAEPVRIEPLFQEIMGWDAALCDRAASPTYPNLIDERHVVAELYNMTNVPMAVWIDERGNIVRPAESAGSSDGFRSMDRSTFQMKKDAAERGRAIRKSYVDAIREMQRVCKRGGKVYIRIFPDKPITKKPAETRMGKGKGAPEQWVAVIRPGKVLFEMEGVDRATAAAAMRLAAHKLPIKTKFIGREDAAE